MPNLREEITRTVLRLSRRGHISQERLNPERGSSPPPSSREGKQLGNYRILRRLGSGGMGHVYLALDTRLGRHVALKFLAEDVTADYSMLYRLQQEARTASALNHPNIVTVYEIGELAGEPFIASEYIDGATLRTALQRNAIDIPSAIEVAMQVASALLAAHDAGVVHRDLKPGNIMLRPDGYVKVIDFGLAKQIKKQPAGRSGDGFITQPGSVIGTVDYMSPEQARGDRLDHRTDIWSLGVVLYEMLAQRRPFAGQTDSHVIVSILDGTVPPLPDGHTAPEGLVHILDRALAKDLDKRYSSVRQMLADLQQLSPGSHRSGSGLNPNAFAPPRHKSRIGIVLLATFAVILIAIAGAWWWTRRPSDSFQLDSVRQITFNGRTLLTTISPDGNYLAFVTGETGGDQTLYLKQIDSATEEIRIPARRIEYIGLTFSPDSRYLYETEKDDTFFGKLYAMPILGARSTVPVIEDIDGPVSFSPKADQFAFVRFTPLQHAKKNLTRSDIIVASRNPAGPKPRKLISLESSTISRILAWSPKGNSIAAIEYDYLADHSGQVILDVIDLSGRRSTRVLPWRKANQPVWTSGDTILMTAANNAEGDNQAQLREISLRNGEIHEVTRDLAGYRSASLTADREQVAALRTESRANIWVSGANDFTRGQSALAEADRHPSLAWSGDSHVLVNSNRGGFPNLWLFDTARQSRSVLTNEPFVEQDGTPVPGRKSFVFVSNRTGQSHLWRFDPDANKYLQLTSGPNYEESPSVSPDGRSVIYTSWDTTSPHLRKVYIEGGNSIAVGNYLARYPQVSPDGKWIACQLQDPATAKWTVAVIPFDGSGPPRLLPTVQIPFRWSPDGKSLSTALTDKRGASNIWNVPLDGSLPQQLTRFDEENITAFAWSPDATRLACIRVSVGADAVLFKTQHAK